MLATLSTDQSRLRSPVYPLRQRPERCNESRPPGQESLGRPRSRRLYQRGLFLWFSLSSNLRYNSIWSHPGPLLLCPVSNHGIPESVVEQALHAAKTFFSLSLPMKEEVAKPCLPSCRSTR